MHFDCFDEEKKRGRKSKKKKRKRKMAKKKKKPLKIISFYVRGFGFFKN